MLSVTLKTFPEVPTAGVTLSIRSTGDLFWKGVAAFHNLANLYVENGMFVYYEVRPLFSPTTTNILELPY